MKKSLLALSVAVGISLTGCGGKDPQELIQSAQQNLQQGDEAAAVVELKTVLQEDPRNTQARFMLGKLYSDNGGAVAATKELFAALEGGYDINAVTTELAPMLYLQSDTSGFNQLLDRRNELNATAESLLIAYDGLTSLELGELERAADSLREASAIEENQYTQLLRGYIQFSNGDVEGAMSIAKNLVAENENFAESHFLLGQLALMQNNAGLAVSEFDTYHELMPENFRGTVFLANALVKNKDYNRAEPLIDQLLSVSAEQPFLNFLKSVVSFQNKDYKAANLHSVKAIQNGYTQDTARVIAGLSAFLLDKTEQAYDQLVPLKDKLSSDNPVMKLLSHLSLQLGYLDTVDGIMAKDSELSDDEIIVLSKVTADLVSRGELERGRKLSSRLKSAQPNSEWAMISKGFAQLTIGDLQGINTLEDVIAQSPDSNIANSALAQAYLDNGLYKEAIELAKQWQADQKDSPVGHLLEAMALSGLGEVESANQKFAAVLDMAPANPTANLYLGQQKYTRGEIKEAIKHLQNVLSEHPQHIKSIANLNAIYKEEGKAEKGLEVIKKALKQSDAPSPKLDELYLISLYEMSRWQEAISYAESLDTDSMTNLSNVVWGNSYYKTGNLSKGIELNQEWLNREPGNAVASLRLISLLELDGQLSNAYQQAKTAASAFNSDIFHAVASDLAIKNSNAREARSHFNKLTEDYRQSPQGLLLSGKLMLVDGNAAKAEQILTSVHKQAPSNQSVWLLAKALLSGGKTQQAFELYKGYIESGNSTAELWEHYAELAIRNSDYAEAIRGYERVIDLQGDNPKIHNNLAYVLMEEGRLNEALTHSKTAIDMAPDAYSFLDTHANILWRQGELVEAIAEYEKLYAQQPENKELVQRFSRLLREAGKTEKADSLLRTL